MVSCALFALEVPTTLRLLSTTEPLTSSSSEAFNLTA